ncbi:MAG: J domain-containing protein [Treponema sp.]|jgi:curved DNA-binding protein CbpA|nr:J domain-containing protein [Treponema sp.]
MDNYYSLLGIKTDASSADVKKAFREKAKKFHPDVVGKRGDAEMRRLISAYKILSDRQRRFEYDKTFKLSEKGEFDYRTFLKRRKDDPASQAKLVVLDLFHGREEDALALWRERGGLDFPMSRYLNREDWMDGSYILAEELVKRDCYYEAFVILVDIMKEERREPYFRHFSIDVEIFLKELVRLRLRRVVDDGVWVFCMETLLALGGFPAKDEARWLCSMAEALCGLGRREEARIVFCKALEVYPRLSSVKRLQKKLGIK